ncbi:MAG: FeoA family protein [Flavobacteriales bacterium]|jgi:ferrous iron transport protein A
MKTALSNVIPGNSATITGVKRGELFAKLTELGLFQGKEIKVLFKAPFGDPIAVDVEGYVLSLRKDEAELVEVEAQ